MIYQTDTLTLDTSCYRLSKDNKPVEIEPQVFDLLVYLIENHDRVVTRGELLDKIWKGRVVSDSALSARLKAARKAVGDNGRAQRIIKTIHRRGYQFVATVSESEPREAGDTKNPITSQYPRPSIAVFPFVNTAGDKEQQYFAEGVAQGISTELSRHRSLVVKSAGGYKDQDVPIQTIAKDLNVRYLLKGNVYRRGDRVRVVAELVDAEDGSTRWSEQFDRRGDDVMAIQDDISLQVANLLWGYRGKIQDADTERMSRKPAGSFDAYDFVLRGKMLKELFTREDNSAAIDCFKQAIALDAQYAEAHSWLAWVYGIEVYMHWSDDPAVSLASAMTEAKKAIELDRYCADGLSALGFILLLSRQHDEAASVYDRLVELYPNNPDCIAFRVEALTFNGQAAEAVSEMRKAVRLNPCPPEWYWWLLGMANYAAKQYKDAIAALNRITSHNEDSLLYLAASHAQIGAHEQARTKIRQLLEIEPDFTLTGLESYYKDPADHNHVLAGLRKAGAPEK